VRVEKTATGTGLRKRTLSIGVALLLYCLLAALAFAPVVPGRRHRSSAALLRHAAADLVHELGAHLLTAGGNPSTRPTSTRPAGQTWW